MADLKEAEIPEWAHVTRERVAALQDALTATLGLIAANRLMLGHYMGPEHVAKVEKVARAALSGRPGQP